jgi:hypothetical protein
MNGAVFPKVTTKDAVSSQSLLYSTIYVVLETVHEHIHIYRANRPT